MLPVKKGLSHQVASDTCLSRDLVFAFEVLIVGCPVRTAFPHQAFAKVCFEDEYEK